MRWGERRAADGTDYVSPSPPKSGSRPSSALAVAFEPAGRRGAVQRLNGPDLRARRDSVRVCAAVEEQQYRLRVPEERGQVERGEAVSGERAGEPGIALEQLLEPLLATEGGRLEDVRLVRQEALRFRRLAAVERVQRGREPLLVAAVAIRLRHERILPLSRDRPQALNCRCSRLTGLTPGHGKGGQEPPSRF